MCTYVVGNDDDRIEEIMEFGDKEDIMRHYTQQRILDDKAYYVSEKKTPLRGWRPHPIEDKNAPKHWFVCPPSSESRSRMLWGWRTNMELATERNDYDKIKDLCERYPPDDVKDFIERRMLLTKAADVGTTKACRALLKYAKAAVDGVRSPENKREWIPLQADSGNSNNRYGSTPLFIAVQNGHEAVVRMLLRHGANVEFSPREAEPAGPLHYAAALGHVNIVQTLFLAGADVTRRDDHSLTPIETCQAQMDWGGYGTKQYEKILKILGRPDQLKRCAACNAKAPKKHCPCNLENYCNSTCQSKRWKQHKPRHKEEMELLSV